MNTSKIKSYAIQARRDFIQAVTERANWYGIFSDDNIEPMKFEGDAAIIGERPFPKREGELREKLANRVKRDGFETTMRAGAYTWFNRFVALRYMEIHDYLDHRYRVLSSVGGSTVPEILENAAEVDFKGLDKEKTIELKLAGTRDNELFRMLLLAQCDALHKSMPFLFDRIDSETELLLPDNLLHSDSPVRKLVNEIDESDWRDVEIIGWIYQFYISERKDQVIGKVVKSEDIPAATQLFTPNWIVKYMVQNTLGRMWLATYPDSPLREKMEYYIEPAEQEPEVQKQIDEITPKELNPEEITFLDPACGSGHILVEAYNIFKEIYLERGYRTRDIPRLILEKNLFGLDICDRAGQLSCLAVLMKAREDDRRILKRDFDLNVMAIQESDASDAKNIEIFFKEDDNVKAVLKEVIKLFENAKTFGSLVSVPENLALKKELFESAIQKHIDQIFEFGAFEILRKFSKQAWILGMNYDCVVTNPPYMGSKGMNSRLRAWLKETYPESYPDLMTCFMKRSGTLAKRHAFWGMINLPSWMFLHSFESIRAHLLQQSTIISLLHLGRGIFGPDFGTVAFVVQNSSSERQFCGVYRRLFEEHVQVRNPDKIRGLYLDKSYGYFEFNQENFQYLPGSPIAYWVSQRILQAFKAFRKVKSINTFKRGIATGDNNKFTRYWHEVSENRTSFEGEHSGKKWFKYNKGGEFRRWYGNLEYVINWQNRGEEILNFKDTTGKLRSRPQNINFNFQPVIAYSSVTSGKFSIRLFEDGLINDQAGNFLPSEDLDSLRLLAGFMNSKLASAFLDLLNPTLNILVEDLNNLPIPNKLDQNVSNISYRLVEFARIDWDSYETSWDFSSMPLLNPDYRQPTLEATYQNLRAHWREMTLEMQRLEEENNRVFIDAYGLQDELTPEVPLDEITLTCNPHYRYGGDKTEEELDSLLLTDTIKEIISYAIGCMMGRYSLDEPGLIYANSGNKGFNPSKYKKFPADDDGIIPIMDQEWFPDDAVNRFVEFLKVAWSPETIDENLKFVADSLDPKKNEEPVETIRRYLSTNFFKDHMKMYKKRPIYWLFSSGKLKAFECLVYLHRYNESTLSRIRGNYVIPLQGNISARLEFLQTEKDAASTASAQKKFEKEIDLLKKKKAELSKFDDELRHCADMKISLDLDDGVKVNYGKFGNLLAEKNAVAG